MLVMYANSFRLLGLDNWDEYVALMENLWLKDITAHEFNDQAKRIFWMCDDRIRVRMNSLVIRRMIVPGLEEQATAKENIDEMMAAAGGATKS
jgi:vacuolar-type H+-ATPase subunit D/Vma8